MSRSIREMFTDYETFLNERENRARAARRIFDRENTLDTVQKEITIFLTDALSEQQSYEQAEEAKQQIRLVDELESVSDYIMQLVKIHQRLDDAERSLSDEQTSELEDLQRRIVEFFNFVVKIDADTAGLLERATETHLEFRQRVRDLRSKHWDRLSQHETGPLVGATYSDLLHSYRKIKEHLLNIAEVRAGEK